MDSEQKTRRIRRLAKQALGIGLDVIKDRKHWTHGTLATAWNGRRVDVLSDDADRFCAVGAIQMGTSKVFETADVYDVMGISKHDVIDVAQQILWEEGLAGDPDTHPSAIVHRPDKHGWEHSIVAANDERAPWAYARIVRGFARATGRLSEVKKAIEQASKRSAAATKAAETRAANRQAMYDAQHAVWMERHAAWLAERRAKEEALAYEAVRAKDQLMVVEQPTVVSAPEVKQELTIK